MSTILITGSTSGLGEASAKKLARLGHNLILIARNKEKAERLINRLYKDSNNKGNFSYLLCDLSSADDIHRMTDEFKSKYDRLDVIMNNAGGIFRTRILNDDGIEMTFALNHLSYFLVSALLLDVLKTSASGRIVNVSSGAHYGARINFDDLMGERYYQDYTAYSQSKLANVMFTYFLSRRLNDTRITVNCLHPGVVRTNFGKDEMGKGSFLTNPFGISAEKGAETQVYLAVSPQVEGISGKYFENKKMTRSSDMSYDKEKQYKLWEISESLIKYKYSC